MKLKGFTMMLHEKQTARYAYGQLLKIIIKVVISIGITFSILRLLGSAFGVNEGM